MLLELLCSEEFNLCMYFIHESTLHLLKKLLLNMEGGNVIFKIIKLSVTRCLHLIFFNFGI
jgi:HKD family nuclease